MLGDVINKLIQFQIFLGRLVINAVLGVLKGLFFLTFYSLKLLLTGLLWVLDALAHLKFLPQVGYSWGQKAALFVKRSLEVFKEKRQERRAQKQLVWERCLEEKLRKQAQRKLEEGSSVEEGVDLTEEVETDFPEESAGFEQNLESLSKANISPPLQLLQLTAPPFGRRFLQQLKKALKNTFNFLLKTILKALGFLVLLIDVTFSTLKNIFIFIISFPLNLLKRLLQPDFLFFVSGVIFAIVFIVAPFEIYLLADSLPSTDLLVEKGNRRSTKILDRNGNLLYEIYEDRKYEPVELDQIPEHVIQATLAVEDAHFYKHNGIRPLSMLRAVKAIVFEDDLQGGSTITQQLIKNVLLTPERTISRKLKEVVLAVLVENRYSKDQILELYLNNISYGGTAWGIEAASQKFFDKPVWELNLAEASMLAGLPSAPSVYSPLNKDSTLAKQRQRFVLDRMVREGYITDEDATEASEKDLKYASQNTFIRAPHFVYYVRSLLEQKYGSRFVTFGGLTVKTSLDLELQEKVQDLVAEGVAENSYLNLTNGAAVVLDAETGEILAYVGSVDFFGEEWGAFDVASAERQPGSSLKPITYALAMERGDTPATLINDSPTAFPIQGQEPYKPVNYDGRFHGMVTIRQALANSYNIPAVKTVQKVTPEGMAELAHEMGLSTWTEDAFYGLSVTLGGKEVRLVDLTNVYATFARGGVYKDTKPLLSVKDSNGKELVAGWYEEPRRVLSEGVSFLITHILSDNNARAPTFGYRSPLYISENQVAVKTGTTDNKRDNWTLGYSPSYVVGVWVGNNDNTPMNQNLASGLTGAAPIWNDIMTLVLEEETQNKFVKPDSVFLKVDEECGRREYFVKGSNVPAFLCPQKDDVDDKDSDKDDDSDDER
ncbi:PBP1A family penicillin-binding protein [candidate division WWE3 bacterium]|nr:PBP1A family penicillin-binding protein [candidate division WWE3 bacterium]